MTAATTAGAEGGFRRSHVLLAFAAIYFIWGSTYLAIRYGVETIPPYLMLGVRFVTAGAILYAWLWLRGAGRPAPRMWVGWAVTGALRLRGGGGAGGGAVQHIPSGLAALIVAIMPVWMVLLDWLRPGGRRPGPAVIAGLLLGMAGMAVLVGPVDLSGAGRMGFIATGAVLLGTISWATGSVIGHRIAHPDSPFMAAALQMVLGGVLLLAAGSLGGEWAGFELAAVSLRSALSLGYLMVFGSLFAFVAYVYLLRATTPARVGSYAYVNPVVAVLIGWAAAGEPVTGRTLVAAAILLTGVALIVSRRRPRGWERGPAAGPARAPSAAASAPPGTEAPAAVCRACTG
ncbi:MAG: EamA family transporter [Gemmatimonadota bacterium]